MQAIVCSNLRKVRELSPRFELLIQGGRGPSLVFLPCEGRNGSALLRCYELAKELRDRGWRPLVLSPKLTLEQRLALLRAADPILIVMQGARHVLNRPEYYAEWPIVYDMDDADFHLPHLVDAVTAAMSQVVSVSAGSRYIANWCRSAGAAKVHVVWTGAPVSRKPRPRHAHRLPVIAWAQTRPMTYIAEAIWVRDFIHRVVRHRPGLVLRLFDRRPGDDSSFTKFFEIDGLSVEWIKAQKYSQYLEKFDDVSLGLAPLSAEMPFCRGKSFGKVLAYLDRHVPVLATENCEHPAFFTPKVGVMSDDLDQWCVEADRLLADADARQKMAEAAFTEFERRLSSHAIAERFDQVLRNIHCAVAA